MMLDSCNYNRVKYTSVFASMQSHSSVLFTILAYHLDIIQTFCLRKLQASANIEFHYVTQTLHVRHVWADQGKHRVHFEVTFMTMSQCTDCCIIKIKENWFVHLKNYLSLTENLSLANGRHLSTQTIRSSRFDKCINLAYDTTWKQKLLIQKCKVIRLIKWGVN